MRLKWNFVKDYTLLPKSQIFVIVFGKENETREMRLLTSFVIFNWKESTNHNVYTCLRPITATRHLNELRTSGFIGAWKIILRIKN